VTHNIRVVGGKLEPTKTFSSRWWKWIETPGLSCDGVLILGQVVEKSGIVDESVYGCEEVPCAFPGGREFAVRKLGAVLGGDDEAYRTQVLPRGSVCTCKAGRTHTEVCRHRCGLTAATQAGAIPVKTLIGA
jgi:hypothetical protein